MWLGFKTPNFGDRLGTDLRRSSGGGSRFAVCQVLARPRDWPRRHSGSGFMVKHSKKPAPRFAGQPASLFLLVIGTAQRSLPGLLSPARPSHLSQMHFKQGNNFSPCNAGDPQTRLPTPRGPPSFPTKDPLSRSVEALTMALTSKTSDFHFIAFNAVFSPFSFS